MRRQELLPGGIGIALRPSGVRAAKRPRADWREAKDRGAVRPASEGFTEFPSRSGTGNGGEKPRRGGWRLPAECADGAHSPQIKHLLSFCR
jgi:hypothetical protein